MNIGDKVRLLKGKEQGVIARFIDNKVVEVEIEDGFTIPVLKSELVVVAKEESDHFGGEPSTQIESKPVIRSNEGLFVAFHEINDRQLSLYLINNTTWEVPFAVGQEENQRYKGIASGCMAPYNSNKITTLEVKDFKQWPVFILQMLFHQQKTHEMRQPLVKKLKFKAASFFKHKRKAPLLEKEAYLFQIDAEAKPIDTDLLKERIFQQSEEDYKNITRTPKPAKVVDLHIENLVKDHSAMSNGEILELQLKTFEQTLDRAIASGMDEITFIHGIGNGTLRNALHKKLSQEKGIRFFKDTMKEKFGYGATLVRIN